MADTSRNPIWVPVTGCPPAILKIIWNDVPVIPNSEYDTRESMRQLINISSKPVARVEIIASNSFNNPDYGMSLFDGESVPIARFQGALFGYRGFGPMCSMEMLVHLGVDADFVSYANNLADHSKVGRAAVATTIFSREKRKKIDGEWYAVPDADVADEPWRLESWDIIHDRPPARETAPWWKRLFL